MLVDLLAVDFLVAAAFLAAVERLALLAFLVAAAFLAAVERLAAVDRLAVDFFAVDFFAVDLLAVDFLVAAAFLAAVERLALLAFLVAAAFLAAVERLAAVDRLAVDFFAGGISAPFLLLAGSFPMPLRIVAWSGKKETHGGHPLHSQQPASSSSDNQGCGSIGRRRALGVPQAVCYG